MAAGHRRHGLLRLSEDGRRQRRELRQRGILHEVQGSVEAARRGEAPGLVLDQILKALTFLSVALKTQVWEPKNFHLTFSGCS